MKARKRFNVLRWGRRGGKSFFGSVLALETMSRPYKNVLYVAPSNTELEGRYLEYAERFSRIGALCKQNKITMPNGSFLDLLGVWRADALRGGQYDRVIFDEAAFAENGEYAWQSVISPMLSDRQGDAYFLSTPKGKNWFYNLDQLHLKETDWASFHFSTEQCGNITPAEIDRARRMLPGIVFAQEYLAEYVDRGAARIKREWLKVGYEEPIKIFIGVDLAISQKETADYTAICVLGKCASGKLIILEMRRGRWQMVDIMQEIVQTAEKWNPVSIAIESNQAQGWIVQELKRTTALNVKGVNSFKDKLMRFQPVEARYEQGLILHSPTLAPEFVDELLSFTGTNADKNDDQVDALSMAYIATSKTAGILV